jgi:hypothetical protein
VETNQIQQASMYTIYIHNQLLSSLLLLLLSYSGISYSATVVEIEGYRKCKLCYARLKYNVKSTGGSVSHSKRHKWVWEKIQVKRTSFKQNSVTGSMTQTTLGTPFKRDHVKLNNLLVDYVVEGNSFRSTEMPGLRNIIGYFDSKVKLWNRKRIKEELMNRYISERLHLKSILGSSKSKISFTTDLWTSPNNKSFMAITYHFLDPRFDLKSGILDFIPFSGSHAGVKLSEAFKKCMDEFDINPSKIMAITLDNASNNNSFIQDLLSKDILESVSQQIRCFAHILNLIAKSVMEMMESFISRIRAVVKKIHTSPQQAEIYETFCRLADPPFTAVKPVLDCETRWNSVYDMLAYAIKHKTPITETIKHTKQATIEDIEWVNAEILTEVLKPILLATQATCGEKFSTISEMLPHMDAIQNLFHKNQQIFIQHNVQSPFVKSMMNGLDKLMKYANIQSNFCTVSVILDPRLKIKYFKEENDDDFAKDCLDAFKLFYEEYKIETSDIELYDNCNSTPKTSCIPFLNNRLNKRQRIDGDELQTYLDTELACADCNPLEWWVNNSLKFPTLASMALDFLAIPATSACSERSFSSARIIMPYNRTQLHASTLQGLVCLRNWSKTKVSVTESSDSEADDDLDIMW